MLSSLRKILKSFRSLDKTILVTLVILALINIIIQYSANDKVFNRLISDIIYLFISFVILFLVANLNTSQLKNWSIPLYIVSIILLIAVMFFGIKLHGAKRWLNLGIRIQPSELCKLSVPLILAYYFSLKEFSVKSLDYLIAFVLILIPCIFIIKQPDLGTGILVFCSGFFIMFLAQLPWRVIIVGLIIFIISTPIIWHVLHDYQKHRILTLLNPQYDPLGKGYHIIQGIIAIGSGGIFGRGYLQGSQIHLDFIPEKHTDFAITVVAEEFGFLGVITLLSLYLILILRGLKIMQLSHNLFDRVLAGSITLSFTLYVLINLGMVAGILPVVGVPLPLISYGGTATIVIMTGFGILLAINRQNKY